VIYVGQFIPKGLLRSNFSLFAKVRKTGEKLLKNLLFMKVHGGEISLEENHVRGTAFKINLPV
jgi:K+-sensing histidine kinase KdpD